MLGNSVSIFIHGPAKLSNFNYFQFKYMYKVIQCAIWPNSSKSCTCLLISENAIWVKVYFLSSRYWILLSWWQQSGISKKKSVEFSSSLANKGWEDGLGRNPWLLNMLNFQNIGGYAIINTLRILEYVVQKIDSEIHDDIKKKPRQFGWKINIIFFRIVLWIGWLIPNTVNSINCILFKWIVLYCATDKAYVSPLHDNAFYDFKPVCSLIWLWQMG